MSEAILNAVSFTDDECLEFERTKSEKLQYFLVNSIKTVNELEGQLKESRLEVIAARNEISFLKLELESHKRKFSHQQVPSSSSSATQKYVGNNDFSDTTAKQKQIQRQKTVPASTSPAAVFSKMIPFSSRVEKAIDMVSTSLTNPNVNIPPKDFLHKFVCRIFDGGDLYYGYLIAYDRQHFQVFAPKIDTHDFIVLVRLLFAQIHHFGN